MHLIISHHCFLLIGRSWWLCGYFALQRSQILTYQKWNQSGVKSFLRSVIWLECSTWPHRRGGGEAAAALWTTLPTIPSARQQQQLGCCDIAGSQRLLWLQRLGCWVETSVSCFDRCQIVGFVILCHSCDRRRLWSAVDPAPVCVDERLHRANALAY